MLVLSTNFWKQKVCCINQQCFALLPQVNFPANNLNFHWRWRQWDQIQAIFLHLFYFISTTTSPLGFSYPPMALSTIVSSSSTRTPNYILRGTYVRLPKVCPSVIIKLLHLIRLGIQKPLYRQDSQWSGFSMQFLISCKNLSFIILKINPKIQKESKICIT